MKLLYLMFLSAAINACNDASLSGQEASRRSARAELSSSEGSLGDTANGAADASSEPEKPNPFCNKKFNIIFLVDSSSSMNCSASTGEIESNSCEGGMNSRIEVTKDLIKDVRGSFKGAVDSTLISYDLQAYTLLNKSSEESALARAVEEISVYDGGQASSNLYSGLELTINKLSNAVDTNIVFIITDGKSTVMSHKVPAASEELKNKNTEIIGVSMKLEGRADKSQLEKISSEVYTINSRIDNSSVSENISQHFCQ